MTSVQLPSASGLLGPSAGRTSKSRSRTAVKPILKKLSSHSERESSLDLDRGWDDQPSPSQAAGSDYGFNDSEALYASLTATHLGISSGGAGGAGGAGLGSGGASARGGGSGLGPGSGGFGAAAVAAGGGGGRGRFSHARSASGNSLTLSIATSTNGGTFVHPRQQTPQTSTPSLSCVHPTTTTATTTTTAAASFDNVVSPTYSPIITEDGGDGDGDQSVASRQPPHLQCSAYQPCRSAPLAAQRTASVSDGCQSTPISAVRSPSTQPHSYAGSARHSLAELNTSLFSPTASGGPTPSILLSPTQTLPSPSSMSPLSPLRSSLDMSGFRLRSRSEVGTATHQEQVREARRKFEAKEQAKEQKYAREDLRKRERAEGREAHRQEKTQSRLRKGSAGTGSISSSTLSSSRDAATTSPLASTAKFSSHGYTSIHGASPAPSRADEVRFTRPPRRSKTAKRKTVGVWTAFVLWLRTRLLRLGRH